MKKDRTAAKPGFFWGCGIFYTFMDFFLFSIMNILLRGIRFINVIPSDNSFSGSYPGVRLRGQM